MKLLLEVIRLALSTIVENKVRSFLTVLGVIIGTGTIIGVGSILAGVDASFAGAIRTVGTNGVIIFKNNPFGATREERQRKPLTYENARAIEERAPSVDHATAQLMPLGGITRARYKGNDVFQPQMAGIDEQYTNSGQAEIRIGRFFTDTEDRHRQPVAVIGEDIYKNLFGMEDPIGKKILVAGREVAVLGVMHKPTVGLPGQSDNRVLLPYFTMRKMFPQAREHILIVIAKEGRISAAVDEMRAILRTERRVPLSAVDNFYLSTADQLVDQFRSIMAMVTLVLVVLSSIGLIVGGIGVMNIMLVSVTERTREIGIRKAIGARRSDIILQFLTEAVILTGLGGAIGMLFGWSVSQITRFLFPALPTTVPGWAVGTGIAVSVGIGIFFGIWPASKAARLDPVDALRYE
jgi:putative ABC transport system permease protein